MSIEEVKLKAETTSNHFNTSSFNRKKKKKNEMFYLLYIENTLMSKGKKVEC